MLVSFFILIITISFASPDFTLGEHDELQF